MIPAISLFLIISLSALIVRIATIALAHTGLSTQSSRFQALSAYTGTGFTTAEAENVINHPVRRKIVYILMILGNAGIITAMSSLILTFVLPKNSNSLLYGILIIIGGLLMLWWAAKSRTLENWLSKIISKALKRYTHIDVKDYDAILRLSGDYQITELKVTAEVPLKGKNLEELHLREKGITVLGILKPNGNYIGSPNGSSYIEEGDKVTFYGKTEMFKEIRNKEKHKQAV